MQTLLVQGHLEGSSIPDRYSHDIACLKMKATPCLHGNACAQSWSHPAALDRVFHRSHLSRTFLQRFGGACHLPYLTCLSWFTLGFTLHHRCRRCHRARRGARRGARQRASVTNAELLQAAQSLQDLQKQWMEIQIEDVPRAQELMQREADLREDLKAALSSVQVMIIPNTRNRTSMSILLHDII